MANLFRVAVLLVLVLLPIAFAAKKPEKKEPEEEEKEEVDLTERVPTSWLRPIQIDDEGEVGIEEEEVGFTERVPTSWLRPVFIDEEFEELEEDINDELEGEEEEFGFTERVPTSWLRPVFIEEGLEQEEEEEEEPLGERVPASFLKPLFEEEDGLADKGPPPEEGLVRKSPPSDEILSDDPAETRRRKNRRREHWVTPSQVSKMEPKLITGDQEILTYGKFDLADGATATFSSPGFPGEYPNYLWHTMIFKTTEPRVTLRLSCDVFEIGRGDYMMVSPSSGRTRMFNSRWPLDTFSSDGSMKIRIRSNRRDRGRFQCTVRNTAPRDPTAEAGGGSEDTPIDLNDAVCGNTQFFNRIVGGQEATPHAFPWLVTLQSSESRRLFCGGSIVNERFVLTAAHCVYQRRPTVFKIGVSKHLRASDPDAVIIGVKNVKIHENYKPETQNYDIAIIELKESVRSLINNDNNFVKTVCLPTVPCTNSTTCYEDRTATLAGWGVRNQGDLQGAGAVEYVQVPIMNNQECQNSYKNIWISSKMVCAGLPEGGKDSCQGDSGGPMTVIDESGRHTLAGIVSFGKGCALPNYPGVYMRVSEALDWIRANTMLS